MITFISPTKAIMMIIRRLWNNLEYFCVIRWRGQCPRAAWVMRQGELRPPDNIEIINIDIFSLLFPLKMI